MQWRNKALEKKIIEESVMKKEKPYNDRIWRRSWRLAGGGRKLVAAKRRIGSASGSEAWRSNVLSSENPAWRRKLNDQYGNPAKTAIDQPAAAAAASCRLAEKPIIENDWP